VSSILSWSDLPIILYGLAAYFFGYWWRYRRDKKISKDMIVQLDELKKLLKI